MVYGPREVVKKGARARQETCRSVVSKPKVVPQERTRRDHPIALAGWPEMRRPNRVDSRLVEPESGPSRDLDWTVGAVRVELHDEVDRRHGVRSVRVVGELRRRPREEPRGRDVRLPHGVAEI